MSEEFDKNEYVLDAAVNAVLTSYSNLEPAKAMKSLFDLLNVARDFNAIENNNLYPQEVKDVLKTVILFDLVTNGIALPTDLPHVFEATWRTAMTVPENLGDPNLIKKDFFEDLNDRFPEHFPLGPDGELDPPEFFPDGPPEEGQDPEIPFEEEDDAIEPGEDEVDDPDEVEDPASNRVPVTGIPEGFDDAQQSNTPLVLDLDGDGIELVSLDSNSAVYWNIDQDDFAEASAWVGSDDGLLAVDLNNDGKINDHGELFGNESTDGFSELSLYDSNSDNLIDQNDAQFGDLLVWVDSNGDAITDDGELFTLSELSITSINLSASLVDYDIAGNNITHESTFTIDGQQSLMVDAMFAYDNMNTIFTGDFTIDERVVDLPNVRGYGDIPDLFISMSMDESLLLAVQQVAEADIDTLFSSSFSLEAKIESILFKWAGVDTVDPQSRGQYIDARKLEFLEKYVGRDFNQQGTGPNPGPGAADTLAETFDLALSAITLQILIQGEASEFFANDEYYNYYTGIIDNASYELFNLVDSAVSSVETSEKDDTYLITDENTNLIISEQGGEDSIWLTGYDEGDIRFEKASNYYDLIVHVGTKTITIDDQLRSDYNGTGNYDYKQVESLVLEDGTEIDLLQNLTFTGTSGNDHVYGMSISDTLIGAEGDDDLEGLGGDDTYVWSAGDGNDTIQELSGIDQLVLHGVIENDIRFEKASNYYDLFIHVGAETITIDDQLRSDYNGTGNYDYKQVESLVLDDGTEIDLLQNLTFTGTSGNDHVYGMSISDTLIGAEGDDDLEGLGGDDTYVWSAGDGNDTIQELSGIDQLVLHGVTENDIRFEKADNYRDLKIHIGNETIVIDDQLRSDLIGSSSYDYKRVESLLLDDATEIDLLQNLTFTGTVGNDDLYGMNISETIIAEAGADDLYAYSGDDTLYGGDGDDRLYGGEGNDALYGGDGIDLLWGDEGADTFAFESATAFNFSDNIQDFDLAEGDMLDVSDLLSGYDPMTDAITDFVQITDNGTHSYLAVDADGGADNFVQVAAIFNETGLTDEAALESSGTLITV